MDADARFMILVLEEICSQISSKRKSLAVRRSWDAVLLGRGVTKAGDDRGR